MNILAIIKQCLKQEENIMEVDSNKTILISILESIFIGISLVFSIAYTAKETINGGYSFVSLSDILFSKMGMKSILILILINIGFICVLSGILYFVLKGSSKEDLTYINLVTVVSMANMVPAIILVITLLTSMISIYITGILVIISIVLFILNIFRLTRKVAIKTGESILIYKLVSALVVGYGVYGFMVYRIAYNSILGQVEKIFNHIFW